MDPNSVSSIVSMLVGVGGFVVALVTLASRNKEQSSEQVSQQQQIADRLSNIEGDTRETKETTKAMSAQLGTHGEQLARLQEKVLHHDHEIRDLKEADATIRRDIQEVRAVRNAINNGGSK